MVAWAGLLMAVLPEPCVPSCLRVPGWVVRAGALHPACCAPGSTLEGPGWGL